MSTEAMKLQEIMTQAQVFASAWSLVGGRFDGGNAMDEAEVAKNELHQMVAEALAQPQQEQMAAAKKDAVFEAAIEFVGTLTGMKPPPIETAPPEIFKPFRDFTEKVCSIFAAPQPAQRKRLTSKEINEWWASENGLKDCVMCKLGDFETVVRAVEDKHNIKEQPAKQEPVGKVTETVDGAFKCEFSRPLPKGTLLYTSPPAQEFVCSTGLCHYRKPLTDEEIESMWIGSVGFLNPMLNQHTRLAFARAIEAKHNIKE